MNPDYTHISFLIDRSGSMRGIAKPMIDGFNEYIACGLNIINSG